VNAAISVNTRSFLKLTNETIFVSFCATIDINHLALYFNYTKKYIHCQEKNSY